MPDVQVHDGVRRRKQHFFGGRGQPPGGVSTPGHGQGEGPDGYKSSRSVDAVDVGRGRSERSEWSPARCWQPPGKTPATHSRGQEGPFCTREAATGRSRGQEETFCTREAFKKADKAPSGAASERQRVFRRKEGLAPLRGPFPSVSESNQNAGATKGCFLLVSKGLQARALDTLAH